MQQSESPITVETAKKLGLSSDEFERICEMLGRIPNNTELSIFSVMWSEECSFKNSIFWLKTLPREGKSILKRAGKEYPNLIDIGDGLACTFLMESQNYPSSIEPDQETGTRVSGIHRNIFAMGARPIASMNSLRFGNIESNHTKDIVKTVVKGIGDYGNGIGVPTVGGEAYFNNSYNQNILVNAMSVGIVNAGDLDSNIVEGSENPVFIVSARTGKEASCSYPFQEKTLLEATLEIIKTGSVIGMQKIGKAGITESMCQIISKNAMGMRIDLDKIPAIEVSRMLVVAKKGEEQAILDTYAEWDLSCEQIGEVTDTGQCEFWSNDEKIAELPVEMLVKGGGAPVYERAFKKPRYTKNISKFNIRQISTPKDIIKVAKKVFSSPNIVSRRWIYEQYDSMVGTNSMGSVEPSDAALVRIKGTNKALAITTDCNSAYVYADPYVGTMIAVAEASRNIICSGGIPVAITNCLNFGDPNDPEVYWQFVHAIKGMGDACRKFRTPVLEGDVSFYNQSIFEDKTESIYPTPVIGMVGILEDVDLKTTLNFKSEGDLIYMLGNSYNDVGSSEYLRTWHGIQYSPVPHFDLHEEYEIQSRIKELINQGLLESAHDVSEGGLFVNLMESAIVGGFGFQVETVETFKKDAFLFGESQSRIVVSIQPNREDDLQNFLISNNVSFTKLGEVFGNEAIIDEINFGSIEEWKRVYENTLSEKIEGK
jgi:phosphoribosylformylglycinamidine synthase